jgi:hypothetical protein
MERKKKISAMKVAPTNSIVVIMASTTGEKTPIESRAPSIKNIKKPIEAKAIFISFVFLRESNDAVHIMIDNPKKENRRNISTSFNV